MALQRYTNNDPTFYGTRQQKFCAGLIKSLKEKNLTLFSDEWYLLFLYSYKFNEIIPLDKWKTTILTRVKAFLPDQSKKQSAPESQYNPAGKKV